MKIRGKKPRKGLVLPAIFSVVVVLLFLVLAITTQGTTSLRQASHTLQTDQAFYAADAGLARALAEYEATGEVVDELSGKVDSTGATYEVSFFPNDTENSIQVAGGINIPPSTTLMLAEGKSADGLAHRRSAVLVQKGLGSVQVGSLAQNIDATNSKFFAYNSDNEAPDFVGAGVDPNSIRNREAVIATNEGNGTPVTLNDSEVAGNILVGPGGSTAQVATNGNSSVGQIGTLTEEIELPPVEVPYLPEMDEFGDPPAEQLYKPTSSAEHISFSQSSDGKITIKNQCFDCTIYPNGDFVVDEDGYNGSSSKLSTGNLKTGEIQHSPQLSSNFNITITDSVFSIEGGWHGMILDRDTMQLTVDAPTNDPGQTWGENSRQTFSLPSWLADSAFKEPPPDLLNPTDLETGFFDEVVIDEGVTTLADSTTLVVHDLHIKDGGQLNLPADGKDVTIYVTGSLTVEGNNAILNEARKAPELRVYYTGTEEVKISGGASSFLTLIAPDAPITLDGAGSTFFGALATNKQLKLLDAEFYYDTATDGVGVGTDGTTLKVLARQRF